MPTYYIKKNLFKIVTAGEMRPFIDASDPEMKAVLALVWLTGARIKEVINFVKEDFRLDETARDGMIINRTLKRGKTGYPSFSFDDPFVTDIVLPYLAKVPRGGKLFSCSKRLYQDKLFKLNNALYPGDKTKWVTFHYLRHSRITQIAQVLRAFPEELKGWTGHRSSAFEEYFAPRRVDRFKGRLGENGNN